MGISKRFIKSQSKYSIATRLRKWFQTLSLLFFIVIFCHPLVVIASENISPGIFTESPIRLPSGLSVEEHILKGKPSGDVTKPFFEPLHGSEKDILKKHTEEQNKVVGPDIKVYIDKEAVEAEEVRDESKVGAKVSRNGKIIFTMPLGDSSPVDAIRGLWSYKNLWILEVAYCSNREVRKGKGIVVYTDCNGEIIQDGKSFSKEHGYQETFGRKWGQT